MRYPRIFLPHYGRGDGIEAPNVRKVAIRPTSGGRRLNGVVNHVRAYPNGKEAANGVAWHDFRAK